MQMKTKFCSYSFRWYCSRKYVAQRLVNLKVVHAKILLVCFVCLNKSTCETSKNVFLFFIENSWIDDVMKCLSMKHETHISEQLGK